VKISIKKITDIKVIQDIVKFCWGVESRANLAKWYKSEHSTIYTQQFLIYCEAQRSVMSQLRTHEKLGCQFFSSSGRPDALNPVGNDRRSMYKFVIWCNARHIQAMAHKRLCNKAESPTRDFIRLLKKEMLIVDEALSSIMIPKCKYLRGGCNEFIKCKI